MGGSSDRQDFNDEQLGKYTFRSLVEAAKGIEYPSKIIDAKIQELIRKPKALEFLQSWVIRAAVDRPDFFQASDLFSQIKGKLDKIGESPARGAVRKIGNVFKSTFRLDPLERALLGNPSELKTYLKDLIVLPPHASVSALPTAVPRNLSPDVLAQLTRYAEIGVIDEKHLVEIFSDPLVLNLHTVDFSLLVPLLKILAEKSPDTFVTVVLIFLKAGAMRVVDKTGIKVWENPTLMESCLEFLKNLAKIQPDLAIKVISQPNFPEIPSSMLYKDFFWSFPILTVLAKEHPERVFDLTKKSPRKLHDFVLNRRAIRMELLTQQNSGVVVKPPPPSCFNVDDAISVLNALLDPRAGGAEPPKNRLGAARVFLEFLADSVNSGAQLEYLTNLFLRKDTDDEGNQLSLLSRLGVVHSLPILEALAFNQPQAALEILSKLEPEEKDLLWNLHGNLTIPLLVNLCHKQTKEVLKGILPKDELIKLLGKWSDEEFATAFPFLKKLVVEDPTRLEFIFREKGGDKRFDDFFRKLLSDRFTTISILSELKKFGSEKLKRIFLLENEQGLRLFELADPILYSSGFKWDENPDIFSEIMCAKNERTGLTTFEFLVGTVQGQNFLMGLLWKSPKCIENIFMDQGAGLLLEQPGNIKKLSSFLTNLAENRPDFLVKIILQKNRSTTKSIFERDMPASSLGELAQAVDFLKLLTNDPLKKIFSNLKIGARQLHGANLKDAMPILTFLTKSYPQTIVTLFSKEDFSTWPVLDPFCNFVELTRPRGLRTYDSSEEQMYNLARMSDYDINLVDKKEINELADQFRPVLRILLEQDPDSVLLMFSQKEKSENRPSDNTGSNQLMDADGFYVVLPVIESLAKINPEYIKKLLLRKDRDGSRLIDHPMVIKSILPTLNELPLSNPKEWLDVLLLPDKEGEVYLFKHFETMRPFVNKLIKEDMGLLFYILTVKKAGECNIQSVIIIVDFLIKSRPEKLLECFSKGEFTEWRKIGCIHPIDKAIPLLDFLLKNDIELLISVFNEQIEIGGVTGKLLDLHFSINRGTGPETPKGIVSVLKGHGSKTTKNG